MTTQDWMTDLEEDEEFPGRATSSTPRWLVAGAVAVAVVVALAALAAVLLGDARTPRPGSAAAAPAATSASAPGVADHEAANSEAANSEAAAPEVAPVLIQAALDYPGLVDSVVPTAPLVVGTQPVQGGSAPDRVPNFDSCRADPASLQYLPVQIRDPEDWLSATFTIEPTASTRRTSAGSASSSRRATRAFRAATVRGRRPTASRPISGRGRSPATSSWTARSPRRRRRAALTSSAASGCGSPASS